MTDTPDPTSTAPRRSRRLVLLVALVLVLLGLGAYGVVALTADDERHMWLCGCIPPPSPPR
jgi:hypothetical protein